MDTGYALDNLGWYQFERMCQALLRAQLGTSLEAWGGGADFGRDAYSDGPLAYPDPKKKLEGPFVFQVKFVSGANAAGASSKSEVASAVKAEIKRIHERVAAGDWAPPAFYTLMTNAPLGGRERISLKKLLKDAMPDAQIVVHGATDIAASLDGTPQIRTSYPQILGLRDLRALLTAVVAADVISRSTIDIAQAAEFADVFVATEAYNQALKKLDSRGFVVLTGPPEMGKTAAARIIGLAKFTSGWDAYDCRQPADLFRLYDQDRPQVFIADDAFGSTEYRPEIATEWAAQLGRVLAVCDRTHWVIWTSRPALLKTGLERLYLEGVRSDFPTLDQVIVDSGNLSIAEKAQMLYRHAKAANFTADLRLKLRGHAITIVGSPHFTPFRIARLVSTQLRGILELPKQEQDSEIHRVVHQDLQVPSHAMKTSFSALPEDSRMLLVAMLNGSHGRMPIGDLEDHFRAMLGRPPATTAAKLVELVEDHFLSVTRQEES